MNFPDDGFEMDQQMGPIQQDMVYQPPGKQILFVNENESSF